MPRLFQRQMQLKPSIHGESLSAFASLHHFSAAAAEIGNPGILFQCCIQGLMVWGWKCVTFRKISEGRLAGRQGGRGPLFSLKCPRISQITLITPSHWHFDANTRHEFIELILNSEAFFRDSWQNREYLILNCLVVENDIVRTPEERTFQKCAESRDTDMLSNANFFTVSLPKKKKKKKLLAIHRPWKLDQK